MYKRSTTGDQLSHLLFKLVAEDLNTITNKMKEIKLVDA